MGTQIRDEVFVRIEFVVILLHHDGVTLEEPVGLVARQEHLVGRIINVYRASFCDFLGVSEAGVIWVCHFSKAK